MVGQRYMGICIGGPYDGQGKASDKATVEVFSNDETKTFKVGEYRWSERRGCWTWHAE